MKLLIAGDYCDHGRVSDLIHDRAYDVLFNDIKNIVPLYDYRIVNFEFPVVSKQGKPIRKCGPSLQGQAHSIDALKYAGFNVCTLANNHILDQGSDCLLDTIERLNAAEIKTVGAGLNLEEAAKILFLEKDGESVAIINCCEHEFSIACENAPGTNPLNPVNQIRAIIEARKIADFVVVIVHGGVEHFQYPTTRMKELYRLFIEMGANAVINHHQHCYCGYEVYNNCPIFYGLGNFLFDWIEKRNSMWNTGVMVGLDLSKNEPVKFVIYPFEQCNENPNVQLLEGDRKKAFFKEDFEIRQIINDQQLIKLQFDRLTKLKTKEYQLLIEPYDGRLLKGLFYRGVVPSLLSEEKKTKLLNYIYCESHNEVLISVLKDLINKPE